MIFFLTVYVDMGTQPGDTATLSFTFGAGTSGNNRLWEIKVTQISLKSDIRYVSLETQVSEKPSLVSARHQLFHMFLMMFADTCDFH